MMLLAPCFLFAVVNALPQPQDDNGGGLFGIDPDWDAIDDFIENPDWDAINDAIETTVEVMDALLEPDEQGSSDSWKSDETGTNTRVGVSRDRIDWGDQKPWEVVEELLSACHFNACPPDTKVTQDTTVISAHRASAEGGEITVRADGIFEDDDKDEASLSTLIEVAVLAFKEFSESEERTSKGINSCTANGQCQTVGQRTSVQYNTISAVTITVHDEDRGLEGHLGISVEVDQGNAAEKCSDIVGTAGSIAGEMGSWTAPLTLGSLVCSAVAGE